MNTPCKTCPYAKTLRTVTPNLNAHCAVITDVCAKLDCTIEADTYQRCPLTGEDVMRQLRAAIVARLRELAQEHLDSVGGPGFNRDDGISTGMAIVLNGQHRRAAERLNGLADRWERDGIPCGYEEFVNDANRL